MLQVLYACYKHVHVYTHIGMYVHICMCKHTYIYMLFICTYIGRCNYKMM